MAELTQEEWSDFEDLAFRAGLTAHNDYSGRGMMGTSCLAISGSWDSLWKFLANFQMDTNHQVLAELITIVPRQDSLGKGSVWYWPSIRVADEVDE